MIGAEPTGELINTSTPEALERDFNAWLKGELMIAPSTPFGVETDVFCPLPPIDELALGGGAMQKSPVGGELFLPPPLLNLSRDTNELLSDGFSPAPSTVSSITFGSSPHQHLSAAMDGGMGGCTSHFFQFPLQHETIGEFAKMQSAHGFLYGSPPTHLLFPKQEAGAEEDGKASKKKPTPRKLLNRTARNSGTNQLGRTYNPGLPLSLDERQHIINLFSAGWKICDISKTLQITHSCVSKILNRFRVTGDVRPKDAKESRLESPLVKAIREYRRRFGMVRQSEIRDQLIRDNLFTPATAPSRSSINHILRTKLDVRVKKSERL
ncbi:Npax-2 [Aphelenchoides fujianensis]|nr:Npax-2 [Aphelenchoides fujianensis]